MATFLTQLKKKRSHEKNSKDNGPTLYYPPYKQADVITHKITKKLRYIGHAEYKAEEHLPPLFDDNTMAEPRQETAISALLHKTPPIPYPSVLQEENSWMQAYIDVITLLLTMFVVMMALSEPGKGTALAESIAKLNESSFIKLETAPPIQTGIPNQKSRSLEPILNKINTEKGLEDVEITYKEDAVELRLSSKVLFPSGEATFKHQGIQAITSVAKLLKGNEFMITVEGHSDNVPILGGKFASNWELSSARASTVVRQLIEEGIPSNRLRAVAYADTKPIADNTTVEGRGINRRVVFVLEKTGSK